MRALPASPPKSLLVIVFFTVAIPFQTVFLCSPVGAQENAQAVMVTPPPLITEALDESRLRVLKGNTHPLARREFDLGTAPASLPMGRMLLVLKRSAEQESALRQLLDDQQDKNSPSYHKWLTPEQFGAQFGPSAADMQTITNWLQSHGFRAGTTKGRAVLEFSGSASQVQEAFHTSIHSYLVNGEQHWANANDPSIPAALTPAVAGVLTLHNFTKKPGLHFSGESVPARIVPVPGRVRPQVTFPPQNGQPALNALAPQDYAVIYNINPLYNSGTTGMGRTIAVVGRSNLFNGGQDVSDFFSQIRAGNDSFASGLTIVLNGPDPGDLGGGEEAEATLDSTWSEALAPGAAVSLVVSASTNASDGVDLSEAYIVENNLADIMTESFSACELFASDGQLAGQSAMAEQAAAEGITYFVSSGDDGAEGCDDPNSPPATSPISVNFLASTAFNVAVGGTIFNESGNTSRYWLSTQPISESAISYIPENAWNESSLSNGLWATSGGASAGNAQAGGTNQGVPKPYWQSGVSGIPADHARDLPDVSLTAAEHDPYLVCLGGSCTPDAQGNLFVYLISGTSASAPSFAGIMALIDQGASGRQGLANYILYRLAAQQSAYPSQCDASNPTTPPASTCIFNDVTAGNNVVPGEVGTNYQAGNGYDQTTGLGSVNVANLEGAWSSVNFNATTTTLTINGGTAVNVMHGQSVPLAVTVAPSSPGATSPTPAGNVVLLTGNPIAPNTMDLFQLNGGQVISATSDLPGSGNTSYSVWAHYAGDPTYAPSNSTLSTVTVTAEPSATTVSALTFNQNGNAVPFTNGQFGSFVYLRADVTGQSGHGHPTGSVTFSDTFGPVPGGNTFMLNGQGNTATPNGIFTFDGGTHTISASYSGDPSFGPSTAQPQTFTITPGFFATLSSAQSRVIISAPGGAGSTSISVVNSSGFSGTIRLACSGLPSESACSFSPASVAANGTAATTNVSVTVSTTAPVSAQGRRTSGSKWRTAMGLALPAIFLVGAKRRNRGLKLIMFLTLLTLIPACGGAGSHNPPPDPGTPQGTSNVTVTATTGSNVSQTGFALIVQ